MKDLCMNMFPDTLRSVIDDLNKQILDYESEMELLDSDDLESLKNLKVLIVIPLEVYKKHNYPNGYMLELCDKYIKL